MTRHAARTDENHSEIELVFRQLLADHVTDSSGWGDGAGDLYVSFGGESGPAYGAWIEIKRDEKASLTAHQIRFRKTHPGTHFRIWSVEQAVTLCGYIRAQVARLQVAPEL